jgi:glycerol kinase
MNKFAAVADKESNFVCPSVEQGNRTPYTDAASRGALVGLTLKHGQAHVFRWDAVLGLCCCWYSAVCLFCGMCADWLALLSKHSM